MSWTFLRRSWSVVFGVLIAVTCVLLAQATRRNGVNLWSDLMTGLSQTSLYTGVLAAGFCAWQAGRWSAPMRTRSSTSTRLPSVVQLAPFAATVIPVVAGYVVAIAVLLGLGLASGTYGVPYIPWLVALGTALLSAAVLGCTIGLWFGSAWFVSPLAAVAFLSGFVLTQSMPLPYWARCLFPVILNMDSDFVAYIPATMWGQSLFFVAVSCLMFLLVRLRNAWTVAPLLGVVFAASVAVGGASLVASTNGQYTTGHNPRDFACTGQAPRICLDKGYAVGAEQVGRAMRSLNEKVAGTPLEATVLEQNVEGIGDEPAAGARSIYLEGLGRRDISFAVERYVEKYGGMAACTHGDHSTHEIMATGIVDTWLSGYDEDQFSQLLPQDVGYAQYTRMTQMAAADGKAWFRDHYDEYASCTLTLSDLP